MINYWLRKMHEICNPSKNTRKQNVFQITIFNTGLITNEKGKRQQFHSGHLGVIHLFFLLHGVRDRTVTGPHNSRGELSTSWSQILEGKQRERTEILLKLLLLKENHSYQEGISLIGQCLTVS